MSALQSREPVSSECNAMDQLQAFLRQTRQRSEPAPDFEAFEQTLHCFFVAAEREALGQELARFDLDAPQVEIDGERYDRVLRCKTTYTSAAGPVRVARSLYRRPGGDRARCPLELRAGIMEGSWTPQAAKHATWATAHLTPQEGEDLFELLGNMTPSKSPLDRLPKGLSRQWEEQRPQFEATLHQQERIPEAAVSIAVSRDGVMAPMKDGKRQSKRHAAVTQGKSPSGPAGYQEVGCATLSSYDRAGARLLTRRLARMPESHKATLKTQWTAEVMNALVQRPQLQVVKVADGAADNWTYLGETLPFGHEVLDFSHAAEHLGEALGAAYGAGTARDRERLDTLSTTLRDAPQGVDKVIEALCR